MFKIIQHGANRLDIELSGKSGAKEIKLMLDEFLAESEDIESGMVLCEIIDFHLPSLRTVAMEFARSPSIFGLMKKFDRVAVLADNTWFNKVVEIEGVFYPGLEIKAFNLDQREESEAWLSS